MPSSWNSATARSDCMPFGLVDGKDDRPPRPAQQVGDAAVLLGEAAARVDQEHHDVGFGDRGPRLLRHLVQDAVLRDRLEAAGVDDQERALADARRARSGGRG